MKCASLAVGSLPLGLEDMAETQGNVGSIDSGTMESDVRALPN